MSAPLPSAPPAAPVAPDYTAYRLGKLQQIAAQYEIRPDYISKARQLEGFDIVVLFDDSGSMKSEIKDSHSGTVAANPYGALHTRWSEAQTFANIVVETATCLDPTGIDVRFLNRPGFSNVASVSQIQLAFGPPPIGFTPLCRAVKDIFREKEAVLRESKLLLIIVTDGQPTDDNGNDRTNEFLALLRNRPKNSFVSIVACTDDEEAVDYLNKLDRVVPGLDVSDDYLSEKKEILKAQGPSYKFTFGDYVIKCLLGPVDPSFDNLDEKKVPEVGAGTFFCCAIC